MEAAELLRDTLVIDGHNDTIVAHIRRDNASICAPEDHLEERYVGTIAFPRRHAHVMGPPSPFQIDLHKMARVGIDAAFFAIDVTAAFHQRLVYALDGFGFLFHDLDLHHRPAIIVQRAQDIVRARAEGKPAILLAIEHADATERSLNVLRSLYELGVRSIGLTHNISSQAADGCLEAREGVGLSRFGVQLVREMNRLGMVVDLAHVSPGAFFHALEISDRPVLFSHGNARHLCDHPRNLTDEQLRALAQNKGVIGLSFVPFFVDSVQPTLERWLDHVDHIVDVAGIDHVALGSDFDGGGTLLTDALQLVDVVRGLMSRGYDRPALTKILGENLLRVLFETIG